MATEVSNVLTDDHPMWQLLAEEKVVFAITKGKKIRNFKENTNDSFKEGKAFQDKKIHKAPFKFSESRKSKPSRSVSRPTDSLEAQAFFFKKKRKDMMHMFGTYSESPSAKPQENRFDWDAKTLNAARIEDHFLKFFNLKDKYNSDGHSTKKVKRENSHGISMEKISDFLKKDCYKINIDSLPKCSFNFGDEHRVFVGVQNSTDKSKLIKAQISQAKEPLIEITATVKVKPMKTESYNTYQEILNSTPPNLLEKLEAKQALQNFSNLEREKTEMAILGKAWQSVVRAVIRSYKYNQKERSEKEQNCRRLALLCVREAKKAYMKSIRIQKDCIPRGRKLHREMASYWKKKERELAELRRRKEKMEVELQRRDEEEKEAQMQKKRLEYLMRQSDIYAHFMAKKLGITIEKEPEIPEEEKILDHEEEKEALLGVQEMINSQRQRVSLFGVERQGPEVCTKEEILGAQPIDFSFVPQETQSETVFAPESFIGKLKDYQLKGLRWLDNLYEQGINGILADEMGLGKTIQAIALMAHIATKKNNWGPFLIIAPSSTLYNWRQEIHKFCPSLKVLPYWGSFKDRKVLRKYFSSKLLGQESAPFHIVITSYQLVVADEKTFQRMRWQHMILDEAQAIKSVSSQRWKTLLSFNSRNKLLLTGTPIQNSMAELWALLHFIMPKLFDSHEHFQEWFSKDIEAHSQDMKVLNQHQLNRLHMILKPFMLRRIKKDVEHEIGSKEEILIQCEMTSRQKILYQRIKSRLSVQDFFRMFESQAKVENLMNLVMQFRKICNHPELFERRSTRSPFLFRNFYFYTGNVNTVPGVTREVSYSSVSPISLHFPKIIIDDLNLPTFKEGIIIRKFSLYLNSNLSILDVFGFSKIYHSTQGKVNLIQSLVQFFQERNFKCRREFISQESIFTIPLENINDSDFSITKKLDFQLHFKYLEKFSKLQYFIPRVTSITPFPTSSSSRLVRIIHDSVHNIVFRNIFTKVRCNVRIPLSFYSQILQPLAPPQVNLLIATPLNYEECQISDMTPLDRQFNFPNLSQMEVPDYGSLIADSAKLKHLDSLLKDLYRNGHRVLIFCQMTRMMDILEDFLSRKKYTFFRLDGSCNIVDRRDMVDEFQTNPRIFAFLLSTRAGGLGVTLTAADTVIFYDNDWNPTMDAQATDRAHRIGQEKNVRVFRLVTKGTIEERILKRAQQKQNVQATVYAGGAFKADTFRPHEMKELLFDEKEIPANTEELELSSMKLGKKKRRGLKELKERLQSKKNMKSIELDFSDMLNNEND